MPVGADASCLPSELRPLNSTHLAQNGQTARASHTELHGKAPDCRRSTDGAPARPQDGVSTQDAQHVDTHTTERPGGTRTEIEKAAPGATVRTRFAAPAPSSTRSRKLALVPGSTRSRKLALDRPSTPRLLQHKVSVSLSL